MYLARGDAFADAVAAGSLTDGPVLLVPSCGDIPDEPRAYLEAASTSAVVALGGPAAVCDQLLNAAADLPAEGAPGPGPDPDPDPDDAGTLYYSEYGDLMAVDMNDLSAPRRLVYSFGILDTFRVVLSEREFVYLEDDFIDGYIGSRYYVHVRDMNDTSLQTSFEWGYDGGDNELINPDGVAVPDPSPDGQYFIAQAEYHNAEGCCTTTFIEIMDRSGNLVTSFEGGDWYFKPGGAFSDWTWTPDGDLLVTIDAEESDALDEGAVLALIERDDLLGNAPDVPVTVLASFPGGGLMPEGMAVTPAGDQIAYTYDEDLYVMPFTVGGEGHRVARSAKPLLWPEFAPGGSEIVLRHETSSGTGISPSREDTHIIPNHRDDAILIETDGPYELKVPQAGETNPRPVGAKGPFYWDQ